MEIIAVDLETTGLDPVRNHILEIGALRVTDGKITDTFSCMINPQVAISSTITNLTGITQTMAEQGILLDQGLTEFMQFAGDSVLMGHNLMFDYSFLKTAYHRRKISFERMGIDTFLIARKLCDEPRSKSLESLCDYFQIEQKRKHRATDDASSCYQVYEKLKQTYEFEHQEVFMPAPLFYHVKNQQPITQRQKNYLNELLKYHKIEYKQSIEMLSKSEASRMIDQIILERGRMY